MNRGGNPTKPGSFWLTGPDQNGPDQEMKAGLAMDTVVRQVPEVRQEIEADQARS
jgi:hypothetical protein